VNGAFYGLGVPKNTPAAINDKFNNVVNAGLGDLTMKAKLPIWAGWDFPVHRRILGPDSDVVATIFS
jgi:hypothetical protein